jgi:GTPase SAR1 family protein
MTSSKNPIYLKLVLVGDLSVGKSTLCRAWNPEFGPIDGYHIYHWNNILPVEVLDIDTPPSSSPPDNR